MKLGFANNEYPGTATKLNIWSSQQQHNVDNDKDGKGHSDTSVHMEGTSAQNGVKDANSGKNQLQEATTLSNMVKELGATCGSEQGKIIDKIRAMEERDRKEAERLGNRSNTP